MAKTKPAKTAKPSVKTAKVTKKPVAVQKTKSAPTPKKGVIAKSSKETPVTEPKMSSSQVSAGPGMTDSESAEAAANGGLSASMKNFRHHPDMENFYRFIHENDLRFEALELIDQINEQNKAKKLVKASKTQPH